jgi:hypothetical protein
MDKTNDPEAAAFAQRIRNRAAERMEKLRMLGEQGDIDTKEMWNIMWGDGGVTEDGFVAAVDPEDMKSACRTGQGSPGAAVGMSALESVCSPESNAIAIWYRLKMLALCDYAGMFSPYKRDGGFTDAVFQVAASFPMKRMEMDVTYDGPPFDVGEFVKQVERASAG